jgi:hypothetical protein
MFKYFHMDEKLFDTWTYLLIDNAYDYRQIGISNDYCNQISEPKYGLRLVNWQDKAFEVVDEPKYTVFLLRHR